MFFSQLAKGMVYMKAYSSENEIFFKKNRIYCINNKFNILLIQISYEKNQIRKKGQTFEKFINTLHFKCYVQTIILYIQ